MINPLGYKQVPLDPKLVGWFAADKVNNINTMLPADNATVTNWYDISGRGAIPTQATVVNKPAFRTNIVNGLPGVHFDSGPASVNGDWLRCASGALNTYSEGVFSIFVAAQVDALTPASGNFGTLVFNHGSSVGSNSQYQIAQFSSGTIQCASQDSSGNVRNCLPGNVAANTPFVVSYYTDSASFGTSSGLKARLDTNNSVKADGTFLGVCPGLGSDGFNLGAQKTGQNSRRLDGYIFEVLVYAREFSNEGRLKIQQYLAAKWAAPYPNS